MTRHWNGPSLGPLLFTMLLLAVVPVRAQDSAQALEEVNEVYSGILTTFSDTEAKLKEAEDNYKKLKACMGSGPEGRECQAWIDLLYLSPGGVELQDKVVEVKGIVQNAIRELDAAGVPAKVELYRSRLGLVSTAAKDAKGALDFMTRFNPEGARGDPTRGLRLVGEIIGEAAGKLPKPLDEIFGEYAKAATAFAKRLDALGKALDNARQGSLCGSYSKYADAQTAFERNFEGANGRTCLTFLEVTDQFRLLSRLGMVFADQDGGEYYIFETSTANGWIAPTIFASIYRYYEATGAPTLLEPDFRVQRLVSAAGARSTPERISQVREAYQVISRSGHHRDNILAFHQLRDAADELGRLTEDGFIGFYLFDEQRRSTIDRIRDAIENTVYVTGRVLRGDQTAAGVPVTLRVGGASGQVTTKDDGSFEVHTRGEVGDSFVLYAGSGASQYEDQSRFVGEPAIEDLVIRLDASVKSIAIDPSVSELVVGERVTFAAVATMTDGSIRDITSEATWSNGPSFTATSEGSFAVVATFMGSTGSADISVGAADEDGGDRDCGEDGDWNEELGECTSLEDALDEATDGESDLCAADELQTQVDRIAELAGMALEIGSSFDASSSRFYKEIYDQNANVCANGILAAAFVGANSFAEQALAIEEEITELTTDLIVRAEICPDANVDTGLLFGYLSQTGSAFGPIDVTVADMESELNAYGCDQQEVEQLGDEIADNQTDPDVVSSGGTGSAEICGDGLDNDGDGLLDEDCETQGNFNVAIILFDSGSAADDIFDLSVSGQGNLGTTPEGGSRTYPLALSAGDYVATVTVVSAPDNVGTYTITIAEGDRVLTSSTGSPGEGASISVAFTVGDPDVGAPMMMMHTGDEVLQVEQR